MEHIERLKQELISAKEIEEIFRISRTTVWRHTNSGLLKKIKVGGKVFYNIKQIKEIINQQEERKSYANTDAIMNIILESKLKEFTEKVKENFKSKARNYPLEKAISEGYGYATDEEKIFIMVYEFLSTKPLKDNQYYNYGLNYQQTGEKLNEDAFLYDLDILNTPEVTNKGFNKKLENALKLLNRIDEIPLYKGELQELQKLVKKIITYKDSEKEADEIKDEIIYASKFEGILHWQN